MPSAGLRAQKKAHKGGIMDELSEIETRLQEIMREARAALKHVAERNIDAITVHNMVIAIHAEVINSRIAHKGR